MSGLGFALSEGVLYMFQSTVLAARFGGDYAFDQQLMTIFHRAMAMPLLHAAWAGTVGWFIGVASTRQGGKWPVITLGLAFMAVMHGLFDVFSDGIIGSVLAGVSFVIFMAYVSFGDETRKVVPPETAPPADRQTFCASCGYSVPAGNKFCPTCGVQQVAP
jgi:RsiW-degrading membrane proteinase PrsW (M82 family)